MSARCADRRRCAGAAVGNDDRPSLGETDQNTVSYLILVDQNTPLHFKFIIIIIRN